MNSRLKNGTPVVKINIKSFVKASDYAKALTNHFFRQSLDFDTKLKKAAAKDVLYGELFFHGLQGEYEAGFFEASYELEEIYNKIYSDAIKWVSNNYPYLLTTNQ